MPPKKCVRVLIIEVTALRDEPNVHNLILMLLSSLRCTFRTHAVMQAEIVALRHQLVVLHRTERKKQVILRGSDPYGIVKQREGFFVASRPEGLL